MRVSELDDYLYRYTESELRYLTQTEPQLSPRYENIPQVEFGGRTMYRFHFESLMEGHFICANKESRFTYIPEHVHSVIEINYVYSGQCRQNVDGREVMMHKGDISLLDTDVPHSVAYLRDNDIVITIDMKKEYLLGGFLQRIGSNGIINNFLVNALSADAAHDQYLLFNERDDDTVHSIIQRILCEYYDFGVCSDKMLDAYMVLLVCEMMRQYRDQMVSSADESNRKIIEILDYIERNYETVTLQSVANHFGYHPNYLSSFIKKKSGRSFKELVILQRMCQACYYLINTNLPVSEVALRLGYSNQGFFYRKFEEIYKVTPAVYREMNTELRA